MTKRKKDIVVRKRGRYLQAYDTKGKYVCATYSYRTRKISGQTRCFPALAKKLGRKGW